MVPRRCAPLTKGYRQHRRRILARDKHRCVECGSTKELTLDHIVPQSRGGTGRVGNLQTLCAPCNRRKAAQLLRELGGEWKSWEHAYPQLRAGTP